MGEFIIYLLHLAAAIVVALIVLACLYPLYLILS